MQGGAQALYSAITDRITLHLRKLFVSAEEYFATLAHTAGAPTQMNRQSSAEAAVRRADIFVREIGRGIFSGLFVRGGRISRTVVENQGNFHLPWSHLGLPTLREWLALLFGLLVLAFEV